MQVKYVGKLIVIEGLDGCGKSTQLDMLVNRLKMSCINCRNVPFPNYSSPACEPVKMYLNGDFGKKPGDVNAFAASTLYAVDRFASFKADWEKDYMIGNPIICGRYVTSNLVHQCSKLPKDEWLEFANWLFDFEYSKIGIPKPDAVIYLNMPQEYAEKLLMKRYEGDSQKMDIHEKDRKYQALCREAAQFAAENYGWHIVNCVKDGTIRSIEDISDEIFNISLNVIKGE